MEKIIERNVPIAEENVTSPLVAQKWGLLIPKLRKYFA